jgi:hypothetical protein
MLGFQEAIVMAELHTKISTESRLMRFQENALFELPEQKPSKQIKLQAITAG